MIKRIILLLTILCSHSSCQNSENKTMNTHTGVEQKTNSKSINAYASVNGLQMYYEIHGAGREGYPDRQAPLVLIHGGGSTLETTFGRVIPEFAKTRQVIAVEMQAHGHTADIDRP